MTTAPTKPPVAAKPAVSEPSARKPRHLDDAAIIETVEKLTRRIGERFPDAGLKTVADDLLAVAKQARVRAAAIRRPYWPLRIGVTLFIATLVGASLAAGLLILRQFPQRAIGPAELIQVAEAAMNDVALIGAAVFFLVTLEARLKRRRALDALHELRSLAHIIDMHQLTKDPAALLHRGPKTASSPQRTMTPFELSRYLDYCTEMLSLCGKIAALYVQDFSDGVAVNAVNEIEQLTTGLSRKIWQKVMLLEDRAGDDR